MKYLLLLLLTSCGVTQTQEIKGNAAVELIFSIPVCEAMLDLPDVTAKDIIQCVKAATGIDITVTLEDLGKAPIIRYGSDEI